MPKFCFNLPLCFISINKQDNNSSQIMEMISANDNQYQYITTIHNEACRVSKH